MSVDDLLLSLALDTVEVFGLFESELPSIVIDLCSFANGGGTPKSSSMESLLHVHVHAHARREGVSLRGITCRVWELCVGILGGDA